MKEYLRLHRLIKKRSLEERIAFTIKPLINIFVDEDKKCIVSFFLLFIYLNRNSTICFFSNIVFNNHTFYKL